MLVKSFDCNNCTKENVCKYREVATPEIVSKVETRIDNEYCPTVIFFTVSCTAFQKKTGLLTRE